MNTYEVRFVSPFVKPNFVTADKFTYGPEWVSFLNDSDSSTGRTETVAAVRSGGVVSVRLMSASETTETPTPDPSSGKTHCYLTRVAGWSGSAGKLPPALKGSEILFSSGGGAVRALFTYSDWTVLGRPEKVTVTVVQPAEE